MRATMPAMMRTLASLPMPRSVICSPSHMMKSAPADMPSMRKSVVLNPSPVRSGSFWDRACCSLHAASWRAAKNPCTRQTGTAA